MNKLFKIQLKMMREEILALYAIKTELEIMNAVNNARIANFRGEEYGKKQIDEARDKIDNYVSSKIKKIDKLIEEVQDDEKA